LRLKYLPLKLLISSKLSPPVHNIMGCTHSIPDYDPATTRAIIAQNGAATPWAAPLRWENNPNHPLYKGGGYGAGGGGAWPKSNVAHLPGFVAWQGRLGQGGEGGAGRTGDEGHGGAGNGGGNGGGGGTRGSSRHGGSRHGSHTEGGFGIVSQHGDGGTTEALQMPQMPASHLFHPTTVDGSTRSSRHSHGPASHHGSRHSHQTQQVSRRNAREIRQSRNNRRQPANLDFDEVEELEESDEKSGAGSERRTRAAHSSRHGASRHSTRRASSHHASSRHAPPPGGNGRFGGGHHGTRVARGPATVANDSEDDGDD